MRGLYTGLATWNLLVLTGFAVVGLLDELGTPIGSRSLQVAALFSAFFCCLVHSLLIAHFIGSMKWIQQSGPTAGIEDTKPLRTAWIRGRTFPLITVCMLLAVAAAILSGGSVMDALPGWSYLVLAFLGIPLNAYALYLARDEIADSRQRLVDVEGMMQRRIAAGEVELEEDTPELREESGRAAGKVLVFLSVNVWVLFVYFRYVLRQHDEPWMPYLVASLVLLFVGLGMLRNTPETGSSSSVSEEAGSEKTVSNKGMSTKDPGAGATVSRDPA